VLAWGRARRKRGKIIATRILLDKNKGLHKASIGEDVTLEKKSKKKTGKVSDGSITGDVKNHCKIRYNRQNRKKPSAGAWYTMRCKKILVSSLKNPLRSKKKRKPPVLGLVCSSGCTRPLTQRQNFVRAPDSGWWIFIGGGGGGGGHPRRMGCGVGRGF